MKTFFSLVQEVQKPGLCYRCGGCVTFCTAVNYGALEIDREGNPVYSDVHKCVECGLCYSICPQVHELEDETRRQAAWSEPMGRVIETTVVRAADNTVRQGASDGGAVTALLLNLFERNRIDGAIVTRPVGRFQREPFVATTKEEIRASSGIFFDTSHGMKNFSKQYVTYSAIEQLDTVMKKGLTRVALVGTPCQIKSLRKMQVLNLIPSDAIRICFGLFCSGNFIFGRPEQEKLAGLAGVETDEISRINLKDKVIITLKNGKTRFLELEELDGMKRYACRFCSDYAAEFSDISFGGIGADQGWTTVMTRTPLGRAVLADGKSSGRIEQFDVKDNPEFASRALQMVRQASSSKKKNARYRRRHLQGRSIQVKI